MRKISHSVYTTLKPRQRIIACIDAASRGDKVEHSRLLETCPKRSYQIRELEFTKRMDDIFSAALAVECDLRESALTYFYMLRIDPLAAQASLQNFANIKKAWSRILSLIGIDPNSMQRAGPPESEIFQFLELLIPRHEDEIVDIIVDRLNFLSSDKF